jgi:hypothetical protein
MSVDVKQPRSRRAVLAGLAGSLAAVAGSAAIRPSPARALNTGNVQLGHGVADTDNDSALETRVNGTASGITAFSGAATGTGTGVLGQSATGDGVSGTTGGSTSAGVKGANTHETGAAIHGVGAASTLTSNSLGVLGEGDTGVLGSGIFGAVGATDAAGIGVYGSASDSAIPPVFGATGVIGQADAGGTAIVGFTGLTAPAATPNTGIYGRSDTGGAAGRGLTGHCATGIGLLGETISGVGVRAYCGNNTGVGLRVTGKVAFDRSGKLTVTAGHSAVAKTGIGLTASSFILATLQTNVAGLFIQAVVTNPAGSSFTVYLNKAPTKNVAVAWLAVN